MTVFTKSLTLILDGDFCVANITEQVRSAVQESGIQAGIALVFYPHTTGAVTLVEHEAGIIVDLEDVLERIAPAGHDYKHHIRGYDTNGAAHVRTALLTTSVTIPVIDSDLLLGTYQEILAINMDAEAPTRTVVVQVMGE